MTTEKELITYIILYIKKSQEYLITLISGRFSFPSSLYTE